MELLISTMTTVSIISFLSASYLWLYRFAHQQGFDKGHHEGFVEGLNNKIRDFQRRAYGIRDEEYLKLKILTFKLKPL